MSGRVWTLQLPEHPVRGAYVDLGPAWAELVAKRGYNEAAAELLGQTLLALPMMGLHLKTASKLSLQISQVPPLQLLSAQAATNGDVRGLIKMESAALDASELSGQMVVTLEPEDSKENYQGIVALQGSGPADWLQQYFERSEQVATRFVLCADGQQARGLMLQAVPGEHSEFDWMAQVDALDVDILPAEPGEWLSAMLGVDIRVSAAADLHVRCNCNQGAVAQMLLGLGQAEVKDILQEQGKVEIECGYCGENYTYDDAAVQAIYSVGAVGSSVH
ncbi:MAG: Hsp33 family molecular chaperone HslO [Oceanococcus sp.]